MTLILRKCHKDGRSRNGFYYGQVGERVNCPDWDPSPTCGHGLHGLKEGNGDWDLLCGLDWLIIDADDQIVDIDNEKCKFNTGVIKFRGNFDQFIQTDFFKSITPTPNIFDFLIYQIFSSKNDKQKYIDLFDDQNWFYLFAKNIGFRNLIIDKITESKYAWLWACNIGNKDVMVNKINDSSYALLWAQHIGNRDVMINKIDNSADAFNWAFNFGNRDIMINKITESKHAYHWALHFGNNDIMIDKINDSEHAYLWAKRFGDRDVMISKITESKWAYWWARELGNNDVMEKIITDPLWIKSYISYFHQTTLQS